LLSGHWHTNLGERVGDRIELQMGLEILAFDFEKRMEKKKPIH
jgi:hypothetical protein